MKKKTSDGINLLDTFVKKINTNDPAPYMTFIVSDENKTLSIIGGSSDSLNVIHIPIKEHLCSLKEGVWSIKAEFFKKFAKETRTSNTISFLFNYDDNPKYPKLSAIELTYETQGRYCQSFEAYQPHIKYYLQLSQQQSLEIKPQHSHEIIHIKNKHNAFKGLYINKEQQTIRVVNGDNIIVYDYPEKLIDFPVNIYLTAEAVNTLNRMDCSSSNTLSLCIEQDQVLFSSPAGHFSSINKMPDKINADVAVVQETEISFIAENSFLIQHELKGLNSNLDEIKNTNTGFFYFSDRCLYILAAGSTMETIAILKAEASSQFNDNQLFRFTLTHLKEICSTYSSKANYNKTNIPQISINIYKTADNTRKLHIRNSTVETLNTIPIEKDNSSERIEKVKNSIQSHKKNKEIEKLIEKTQLDLFNGDT